MQIRPEEFLPIAERAGALCFLDIEASNLKADFGTVVVVSVKPFGKAPVTFTAPPGNDKALLKKVVAELEKYQLWVSFYGKLFDVPFLQSRLVRHGLPMLPKRHHVDLYWVVKAQTALSRRNQAHLLEWLVAPERKLSVSPNVWAEMAADPSESLKTLVERCESDVAGLEALYSRVKHLVREIQR